MKSLDPLLPAEITIKLLVDTDNFDRHQLSKCCRLEASWSNKSDVQTSEGNKLEDFQIQGFLGDTIKWEAESSSSNTEVNIRDIIYHNGGQIFDKEKLGRKDRNGGGTFAEGKVKIDNKFGELYKYNIHFNFVKKSGGRQNSIIDPKIRILPKGESLIEKG